MQTKDHFEINYKSVKILIGVIEALLMDAMNRYMRALRRWTI